MFGRFPDAPVLSRVVATVPDTGESFEGVLVRSTELWHVLEHAEQLVVEGEVTTRVPVDGRLWLDRLSVPYLQEPDPAPGSRR